ncbi:hypothetical protein FRB96_004714 [Tulasnella sp. 330]|nr:hypothetical protein FRB96_004714 [Tulasnella sp. 330]KAG8877665.1 hypothetical protein FRB98_006592 [Tulasnella sp. 332]
MSSLLNTLKNASDLLHLSAEPVPSAPDGLTDTEAASTTLDKRGDHGILYTIIDDIQTAIHRGEPIELDEQTLLAVVDAIRHAKTVGVDDRYMLLEKLFTLAARLPPGSNIQSKLENAMIEYLWYDLPHPPATYLGKKYAYRTADGSFNNIYLPDLGRARMPYTRSVQPKNPIPYTSLPDPGLIFDTLLRRDGSAPHPSGISSLLFAFANIIIHSLFKTDERKAFINNTSSYLDLSPLYGDSDAAQKSVRVLDGRGLLFEDTFADNRLLIMPPSTPALLIMFSRNHNYIATKLLQINERGTYRNPPPTDDPAALMNQDDEIFNKARLVNCGHFMNVILTDYIGAILGLPKTGNAWRLNPLDEIRETDHAMLERGRGNAVSVEFNLLYRWHATISTTDEAWTEDMMRKLFPDISWNTITTSEFRHRLQELRLGTTASSHAASHMGANGTLAAPLVQPNSTGSTSNGSTTSSTGASASSNSTAPPNTWTFNGMKRDPQTGRFDDDALANILHNATETVAQSYRARGTPDVMRVVEMLAIEQSRSWGVCTLNEFRHFLGLKAYTSFEQWNPNPDIANAARALYSHVDRLELYPGMQAEDAKKPGPGAGLCPGYTISRAILADAISLTRGDRFYTTDFTPYNLSAWGFQDCALDKTNANGALGGGIGKILLRNLPSNYTYNSIYGLFPFYTPKTMSSALQGLKLADQYAIDRPITTPEVISVNTWAGVTAVLTDYKTFSVTYGDAVRALTNGYGFFIAWDEPAKHLADMDLMRKALFPDQNSLPGYAAFYGEMTAQLIKEKSFSLVGQASRSIDIVQDVLNLVPIHWISRHIAGIPLKTKSNPHGPHTEQEVYQFMEVVFTFIFLNIQPETGWFIRTNAQKVATVILTYVQGHIDALRATSNVIGRIKGAVLDWFSGEQKDEYPFLRRLAESGRPTDVLSYNVLGVIVASSANYAQTAAQIVNFYIDDARAKERAEIIELVKQDTQEGNARLLGYILEAMRLDPQDPGVFRTAAADAEIQQGSGASPIKVLKGDTIFVSVKDAGYDPVIFGPDPTVIDPTRPIDNYTMFGVGMHACLGRWFVQATMPRVIRSVFSLKNVRRAPGQSGKLNRFDQTLFGSTPASLFMDSQADVTPWPPSMMLVYDL